MGVSLSHNGRRRRYPTVVPQGHCRACEHIAPVEQMVPVGKEADLDTLLRGKLLCADEMACLKRADIHYGNVLHVVVEPAERWAVGQITLITSNPRDAERHAHAYRGAVVRWRIHTDYREA